MWETELRSTRAAEAVSRATRPKHDFTKAPAAINGYATLIDDAFRRLRAR